MTDTGDRTSGQPGVRVGSQRRLGRSDVAVSALGLGTAPLGGLFRHVEVDDALAVVRRAIDVGLTYLDTAPQYGHGTAERRLGEALLDVPRSSYVLSTKVGRLVVERPGGNTGLFQDAPPSDVVFDFSRSGVLRSLEASLERLGLDRVDVVYIHDPDDNETQALDEAYPALEELRTQGVVGAIGVGMNVSRIPTRFVRETDVDAVLLAGRYTLLDQSGAADLLPAAAEKGVSVVIGGVYNSGILADPRPGATYDYADAAPEVVRRAQRIAEVCRRHDVPLTAAAIQFPFGQPAVACVLTGSRDVRELEENRDALEREVPPSLWQDLVADGLLPSEHAGIA